MLFRSLRRRVTYTNVLVTIVLVFAMSGGALAARHYLITSTKQISPKVLKQLKGARGPAGPSGASGPVGSRGPAGANGKDGANGGNGKSVVATNIATGGTECAGHGGTKLEVEGSGKSEDVCNGQTGYTETLPSGKSETGLVEIDHYFPTGGFKQEVEGVISFPIPVSPNTGKEGIAAHVMWTGATSTTECPGSFESPEAKAGNLCVYVEENKNAASAGANVRWRFHHEEAGRDGGVLIVKSEVTEGSVDLIARWIVTAE